MKIFIPILVLLCLNSYAQKQIKTNTASFKPIIEYYIQGNSKVIGNSILGHHKTKPFMVANKVNDEIKMTYIDVDDDPNTFSSSQSKLTLPDQDCKIVFAGLYWSATYKTVKGVKEQKGNRFYYKGKGTRDEDFNTIKFKTPNSNYQDITGQIVFDKAGSKKFKENRPYVCYKEVTQLINESNEKTGFYTIANVKATEGFISGGSTAGWMLYIIYETADESPKYITAYNGFSYVNENVVDIKFENFHSLDSENIKSSIVFAALEGDSKIKQDQCTIIKADGLSYLPLNNSFRPARNFFNSKITSPKGIERIPNSSNTLGFDIAELDLDDQNNEIINGNTKETTIRLKTRKDRFYLFFTAFQTEISQSFYKEKNDKNDVNAVSSDSNQQESRETILRNRRNTSKERRAIIASNNEKSKAKRAIKKRNNSRKVKQDPKTSTGDNVETELVSTKKEEAAVLAENKLSNSTVNREVLNTQTTTTNGVVLDKASEIIRTENVSTNNTRKEVNSETELVANSNSEVSREKTILKSRDNSLVQKELTREEKRDKKALAKSKKRQERSTRKTETKGLKLEESKAIVLNKADEKASTVNAKSKIEQAEKELGMNPNSEVVVGGKAILDSSQNTSSDKENSTITEVKTNEQTAILAENKPSNSTVNREVLNSQTTTTNGVVSDKASEIIRTENVSTNNNTRQEVDSKRTKETIRKGTSSSLRKTAIPKKTYAERELEKLEKKKGTEMPNMDAGYYVVTNVFSQPELSSKWQSKLIYQGYKPKVIINPKNNWHYVYLLKTQNPKEAINKKNTLRYLEIFKEAWVFKINL